MPLADWIVQKRGWSLRLNFMITSCCMMVRASQVHGVKRPAPHPDPECNGEDEGEYRKGHIDARKCNLTDARHRYGRE